MNKVIARGTLALVFAAHLLGASAPLSAAEPLMEPPVGGHSEVIQEVRVIQSDAESNRVIHESGIRERDGFFQRAWRLPRGRRYLNGRYFGNFNNRYYGPQYGYF